MQKWNLFHQRINNTQNGTTEYLLTNILDKNFTIEDFNELYNLRRGIETNYNTMKNRLNIENYT